MKQARVMLWILLGLGLMCYGFALLTEPTTYAHFQLDRVLTPAELQDPAKRQQTLAFLERANGNVWVLWALVGTINIAASVWGLFCLRNETGERADKPSNVNAPHET